MLDTIITRKLELLQLLIFCQMFSFFSKNVARFPVSGKLQFSKALISIVQLVQLPIQFQELRNTDIFYD